VIRILHTHFPTRTLFLGIAEACLVPLAFVAATVARLGSNDARIMLSYEQGLFKISLVSAVFVTCMYYFDLYDSTILSNRREVLTRLIQVLGAMCILMAALYYLDPSLGLGRGIFLIGLVLMAFLLLLSRRLFVLANTHPQFAERVLVLGEGELSDSLICEIQSRRELGVRVVGHIKQFASQKGLQNLVAESHLAEIVHSMEPYKPDRIIVAMGDHCDSLPVEEALLHLRSKGVLIQDGLEVYEAIMGKIPIQSLRLSWLLFSPGFRDARPFLVYKRICSILLSAIGLVLTFPLLIFIGLIIRVDSPGPVIFRQKRVGKHGQVFTLYKFRTMVDGADQNCRPAEKRDDRFTRVGGILRRTRLDELPQLVNIFRGDMHLIGPRPFVPNQEQECLENIPYYRQRWAITPGATGWAQVNRGYNVSIEDNKDKLAYDLFYIKHMSIGLDLLILFKTIKILLLGRGGQ
jgi:exopolysaccharide biosynthesis polyprenyl glycosylphosphotransferase